jgi:hypothetical protein
MTPATATAPVASPKEQQDAHREAVIQRLKAIYQTHSLLTPDLVIQDAKNPKSPLHDEFEWNDKAAAHQYRIEQARKVIQTYWVSVKTETTTVEVPYFVRDPEAVNGEQGYVSNAVIMKKPELAARVFMTETAKAHSYLNRAMAYADVLDIKGPLSKIVAALESLREHFTEEE